MITRKALFPVTDEIVVRPPSFEGKILECYNCFLPDELFFSLSSPLGNIQGGVRYGPEYWKSHHFEMNITFAFTPVPANAFFSRLCHISSDFDNALPIESIVTWTRQTHLPPGVGNDHPSNWSAFIAYGPIALWEANCRAAMSRAGSHGFSIAANPPNLTPPGPLDATTNPRYMFMHYLRIFENLRMGNDPRWFSNADAKRIITHSESHSIIPAGFIDTRIQVFVHPPGFHFGPDVWPFEFSSYEHSFRGTINQTLNNPFVFWIYDYSHSLGITLENMESKLAPGSPPLLPLGHIPHDDNLGGQGGRRWGYRWISNKWTSAPWQRYPWL